MNRRLICIIPALVLCLLRIFTTGDITSLIGFGPNNPSVAVLPPPTQVYYHDGVGHDGAQLWAYSRYITDPTTPKFDWPLHRVRRFGLPLLMSPFASNPHLYALVLLIFNLASIYLLTLALQRLAPSIARYIPLGIALSPALWFASIWSLADIPALAAAAWAIVWWKSHPITAPALLLFAGLTREAAFIPAIVAIGLTHRTVRSWIRLAIPSSILVAWGAFLLLRFPGNLPPNHVLPFSEWSYAPGGGVGILLCLMLVLMSLYAAYNSPRPVALWLVFDALILVGASKMVLYGFGLFRVVPLAIPIAIAALMTSLRRETVHQSNGVLVESAYR